MAFDYKKEFKELYQPKTEPSIITVPTMNYLAVRGTGDPNQDGGEYKEAIELLYGVAYTLKMSHKGPHKINGFFKETRYAFYIRHSIARFCSQRRLRLGC